MVEIEAPGRWNSCRRQGARGRRHSRGADHCLDRGSRRNSSQRSDALGHRTAHDWRTPNARPPWRQNSLKRPTAQQLKISPKARRLAKEHGIDIADLRGSGPEGEVLAEDVLALADKSASKSASPVPATSGAIESVSSIARLMAERTTQSWTSVPHFFVVREIDAGGMLAAREKIESAREKTSGRQTYHHGHLDCGRRTRACESIRG